MENKKTPITVKSKKNKVTEYENEITILEEKINNLSSKVEEMEKLAINAQKIIKNIDSIFTTDLSKRYGFDKTEMYYIGAASNRIYKKPINREIVDLISQIDTIDWRKIQKINQYFMK